MRDKKSPSAGAVARQRDGKIEWEPPELQLWGFDVRHENIVTSLCLIGQSSVIKAIDPFAL